MNSFQDSITAEDEMPRDSSPDEDDTISVKLRCEFCKKNFSSKSNLIVHQTKTKKCLLIQANVNRAKNKLQPIGDVSGEMIDTMSIIAESVVEKLSSKLVALE